MKKVRCNVFACDPGESGAIALWAGGKVSTVALGDEDAARDFISNNIADECVAYMELVGGYIGKDQPGSRMFTFGNSFGFARGLFKMAHIKLHLIPPATWMREVLPGCLGMEYSERKRALKAFAQSLHPELQVTLRDGDALALLEYGLRMEQGGRKPVARSRADFAKDAKAAERWAKGEGWPIPKRGSAEHIRMVNFFLRTIKSPAE